MRQGLGAKPRRSVATGGIRGECSGVFGLAEPEVRVQHAEDHRFVGQRLFDQRRQGWPRPGNGRVIDGNGCFADEVRIRVGEEPGDLRAAEPAIRQQHGQPLGA